MVRLGFSGLAIFYLLTSLNNNALSITYIYL